MVSGLRPSIVGGRALLPVLMALLLAACALDPTHSRPALELPAAHPGSVSALPPSAADAPFWQRFGDPVLVQLVEQALAHNHDLALAQAHWQQANALRRQARAERWPALALDAQAGSHRSSADEAPGLDRDQRDGERFQVGIGASWELDLFGRLRAQAQAQDARRDAAGQDLYAAQVAVVGETAASYLRLRGQQARLQVALEHAQNQRRTLELVDTRLDAGLGTPLDSARAQAQLASTEALLPVLQAAIAQDAHRLAVLTGRAPGTLQVDLLDGAHAELVPDATPIATGTPADLLRRRPDVASAERRLAAATADIGVATAELFPRLSLDGLIGTQALSSGDLFQRDSERRWLVLGIDWTFLDAGRMRARLAAAQAGADADLARYQQVVLHALEQTANALVQHRHSHEEYARRREAADASARATALARVQYDGGLIEFLQVLDSERTQLDAEDQLAQARTRAVLAQVDIYRQIAGGWPAHLPKGTHEADFASIQ